MFTRRRRSAEQLLSTCLFDWVDDAGHCLSEIVGVSFASSSSSLADLYVNDVSAASIPALTVSATLLCAPYMKYLTGVMWLRQPSGGTLQEVSG